MRKRQATKRDVLPDPIYNSKVVTKLINQIMKDGKKGTAQRILYDAFDIIKTKTNTEPMEVFEKAMNNIKRELHQFIDDYYDRYSGLYLKSKEFLKKLMLI